MACTMTAQELLNELLALQRQGFDLDALSVIATKLTSGKVTVFTDTSFPVRSLEVEDCEVNLYNE